MTVTELIEQLEAIAAEHPDAEIQLATQPSYPLRSHLAGAVHDADARHYDVTSVDESEEPLDVIWLTEGSQHHDSPYAPRYAFDAS